jgi:hypothetical protein
VPKVDIVSGTSVGAINGSFLASGSYDRTVMILSADTGATLRTLRGHANWVSSVIFSQDGTKVISGSQDETVRVWRMFWAQERRVMGLLDGLVVGAEDWEVKEVCCEIVGRMKRLWEVERREEGNGDEDEYGEDDDDYELEDEDEEGLEEDD